MAFRLMRYGIFSGISKSGFSKSVVSWTLMDAIIDALHPYPKTPYRKCTKTVQPLSFFLQFLHASAADVPSSGRM